MPVTRPLLTALVFAVVYASVSNCDILNPCDEDSNPFDYMDGIYAITRINGLPIPARGFPLNATDFLRNGSMDFRTRNVSGRCANPSSSRGIVLAQYVLEDAAGQPRPGETASGNFELNNGTDLLTISAFNKSQAADATDRRTFTLQGSFSSKYTIVTSVTFTR